MYKLRDWVDEDELCETLSMNERAVEYLENHTYLIEDKYIYRNENAMHIIERYLKYDYEGLINHNKNAVNILRDNVEYQNYEILVSYAHGIEFVDDLIKKNQLEEIDWDSLSRNPAAMHIWNDPKYYDYIYWGDILYNINAVELVKNNLHMVEDYWQTLCAQPHLIKIIEQNMDKINWNGLSSNYNAIHILEQNMDKINIKNLRRNKNGFKLLLELNHKFLHHKKYHKNIVFEYFDYCEKNNKEFNLISELSKYGYTEKHMEFLKHNNNYWCLSKNPNIFEYDYKRMRETRQALLWYNDIKK
jgi:hypothetical protein